MRASIVALLTAICLTNGVQAADHRPVAVYDTRVHKPRHVLTNPSALFDQLITSKLVKSQFETMAAYRSRIAELQPSRIYYITVAPEFTHYVYAAEYQRLVVMCDQTGSDLTVSTVTHNLGHVEMENAFGVKVDTRHLKTRLLNLTVQDAPMSFPIGIVWKDQQPVEGILASEQIGLGLPLIIAPTLAERAVKKKSMALVIGFTVANLANAQHMKTEWAPTFNDPISATIDSTSLPVNVMSLAVLNRTSGNVVISWDKSLQDSIAAR